MGQIWVGEDGPDAAFERLDLGTLNPGHPCVAQGRVYFVADGAGTVANVFSCALDGADLQQHTCHRLHYARQLSTDGQSLVYQCAGEIHLLPVGPGLPVGDIGTVAAPASEKLSIPWYGPQAQLRERFVDALDFLQDYWVHPAGHSLSVMCRGRVFEMPLWEGPATDCTPIGSQVQCATESA